MRLEVRDVENETVYTVDASGAVLGRERARTDINFRDEAISKRHARIYLDAGTWLIEDLGSSNGTWVQGQRISSPTPLSAGAAFTLAQRKFEVVHMEGADSVDPEGSPGLTPAVDDAPSAGVGAVLLAVPKALAFYAAAVPLLAVNPLRMVRRVVDEQPWPTLSKPELAAYGLVAAAVASLVASVFGIIAGLIAGAFSLGGLAAALPVAAISGLVGAVGGYLVHPVLGWMVRLLKGDSSNRSRSNYALSFYAFVILAAVPSGLVVVIGALSIPFAPLIPALLNLLVSLVGVYLAYRWAVAFGVVKGVRYFLVAVGVVALVAGAAQAVGIILDRTGGVDPAVAATQDDLQKIHDRAMEKAAGAESEGDPVEAAPEPDEPPVAEAGEKSSGEAEASEPSSERAKAEPNAGSEAPEVAASEGPAEVELPPADEILEAEHPRGLTEFARYRARLRAIERAIEDDPDLINRKDILDDYAPILRITADADERWRRIMRGKARWEREKILARKKQLDIYKRTDRHVDRLYRTLFGAQ